MSALSFFDKFKKKPKEEMDVPPPPEAHENISAEKQDIDSDLSMPSFPEPSNTEDISLPPISEDAVPMDQSNFSAQIPPPPEDAHAQNMPQAPGNEGMPSLIPPEGMPKPPHEDTPPPEQQSPILQSGQQESYAGLAAQPSPQMRMEENTNPEPVLKNEMDETLSPSYNDDSAAAEPAIQEYDEAQSVQSDNEEYHSPDEHGLETNDEQSPLTKRDIDFKGPLFVNFKTYSVAIEGLKDLSVVVKSLDDNLMNIERLNMEQANEFETFRKQLEFSIKKIQKVDYYLFKKRW